jgi:hypothetical protein
MSEELIEIRYNGDRVVFPRNEQEGYAYHLIIDDGVVRVPRMDLLVYQAVGAMGEEWTVRKITMANSVKHLGDKAFACEFSDVEEIIWSKNLETIGEDALYGCLNGDTCFKFFGPTNFLPPSCRLIGPYAFSHTQCLDMIIIPAHALVHPSAFDNSKMWDSSPINKDANPRQLINWIKNNQHDDYPIHAMFAKTQINPEEIVNELCNNDEYLSSFACKKLHKDKDRYGLTPMDYLHRNPYVDETKFDELKLVKASITFNIDNIKDKRDEGTNIVDRNANVIRTGLEGGLALKLAKSMEKRLK